MKTVIAAGGQGTRIRALAPGLPKPMLPINGRPVLEYEIEQLRDQGFTELILTVSHLSEVIMEHFRDGSDFGVSIRYYREEEPLGNAGALFKLRDELTEDFLFLIGDALFDVDFNRFVEYHRRKGGLVTLFTHPNSHPYDSGIVVADEQGVVQGWLTKEEPRPTWYRNRVNAGIHVLSPAALDRTGIKNTDVGSENGEKGIKVDLDRQILRPLCASGLMYCYDSPEYVKDMGTPDRFESVKRDLASGLVAKKNLKNKQRAIFLDRDGTINRYVGHLRDIDDFQLLDGAAEAIRSINDSGDLCVVVTNQPVIARGELTEEGLRQIHDKMETLLGEKGAYVDGIYVCPHHPDSGYEGEVRALKIDCECRKPKPGLLRRAAEDLNIDLSRSWMIGDSARDVQAGRAAGCRTILLGEGDLGQDLTAKDLLDAVMLLENAGR